VVILFDVSCVWIAVGAAFVGSVRVILQSYWKGHIFV
jgi:hypothetical protein